MTDHDEIERLIPWLVNGTLNETDMDAVNRHLAGCPGCARSVEAEVRFARLARAEPRGSEHLPPAAGAWKAVAAGLPGLRRRRAAPAMLAVLALAVAGGLLLSDRWPQAPAFVTLTTPTPHDGPVVQLMFEPGIPETVIRGVLQQSGGIPLAGPTATGIYRIGLPAGSDARSRAARLHELAAVRWVAVEAR